MTATAILVQCSPFGAIFQSACSGISSMATRQVLKELAQAHEQRSGNRVAIEAVGGVDAARRVAAGEAFDFVVLAADAIDKLVASGQVVAGSRVDLVHSGVAVAVKSGALRPDIASQEALKRAVLAAPTVGYSTGPSGVALHGCSSAGASRRSCRAGSCRRQRAFRSARWSPAARWRWDSSNSAS